MIYKDISSIYKALSSIEDPFKILVIDSKDEFFRDDCVDRYIALCRQRNIGVECIDPLNSAHYQQDMTEPYSLFQQKKMYFVKDATSLKEKNMEGLVSSLKSMREECYFLAAENGSADAGILDIAQTHGVVFSIPSIKPWDKTPFVAQWISAFVRKRSRSISPKEASILAQKFQNDHRGLVTELEKLVLGCEDSLCITENDLEQLSAIESQTSLFALFDAFLKKDAALVAACLGSQQEPHDIGLLRFFKNQLEKLISLAEGSEEPKNKSQERQAAQIRRIGIAVAASWAHAIRMYEVDIRSGRQELTEDTLLAFFLSLIMRS